MQNISNVEAVSTNIINYQFTAIPTNLFFCMDNNCRSMLATLVQLSTYYSNNEGWFFRTCEDLQAQTKLSQNLVKATLQTLFNHNLIEVKSVGQSKGKRPNFFKVNFNEFAKYENIKLEDCIKNPHYAIETIAYKGSNFKVCFERVVNNTVEEVVTKTVNKTVNKTVKSDHNINNINNINNKENINNIYNIYNNKYNILNNILEENKLNKEEATHTIGDCVDDIPNNSFLDNSIEEMNNTELQQFGIVEVDNKDFSNNIFLDNSIEEMNNTELQQFGIVEVDNKDFSNNIFMDNSTLEKEQLLQSQFEIEQQHSTLPTKETLFIVKDHNKEIPLTLSDLNKYMEKKKIDDFNEVVLAFEKDGKRVENEDYNTTPTVPTVEENTLLIDLTPPTFEEWRGNVRFVRETQPIINEAWGF